MSEVVLFLGPCSCSKVNSYLGVAFSEEQSKLLRYLPSPFQVDDQIYQLSLDIFVQVNA